MQVMIKNYLGRSNKKFCLPYKFLHLSCSQNILWCLVYVREQLGSSPISLKLFMVTKKIIHIYRLWSMENSKIMNGNYFREILVKAGLLHFLCQPIRLEVA